MAFTPTPAALTQRISAAFSQLPMVQAIAMGGSRATGLSDGLSDIDLYIYTTAEVPLAARQAIVQALGTQHAELDMRFWDVGDEWVDAQTGIHLDAMYWRTDWIEGLLEQVAHQHCASLGCSTAHWHTVQRSTVLWDRLGWFTDLRQRFGGAYPAALRDAILVKNHAVLRRVMPSYANQLAKACQRGDAFSVHHRTTALLASYFDIIFALNGQLHPGEKRLLAHAQQRCALLPQAMEADVHAVLAAAGQGGTAVLPPVARLLDRLDALLQAQGFAQLLQLD